ncbi:MAG: hypothetical protein AVDCRST_MAG04-2442, partial [uncultured Acetobacteraceae bacterium]
GHRLGHGRRAPESPCAGPARLLGLARPRARPAGAGGAGRADAEGPRPEPARDLGRGGEVAVAGL